MRHRLVAWGLVLACTWQIMSMYQESGDFWWKPIKGGFTKESCRAEVLKVTGRTFIGLIQWYHVPALTDASPQWLKDVMAAKPDGAPAPWIGCVPTELDPNKERQLQH